MAGANIGGVQSYTIPLDCVDLTYLSKYVRTPNLQKRPLWTRKCLDGESEYCHVQIVTPDDNEDCYSEPSDTYKCHICDVHVPTMCYKEHTESDQHETIKNISQKVLERVSKQINISKINKDRDIDKDVYYCVPCSKIIKKENKYIHESSAYHVKSKNYITIVSEFYKIFKENISCDNENDFDEKTNEESDSKMDHFKSYEANNNYDITHMNLCHILNSDDDSVDQSPITGNLKIPTVHQSTSNTDNIQPINDEKIESFEEYLKEMIKKYNLKVNVPVMNGVYIAIVAPNGDTVKVSREHFQSYRQLKNSVYCQLCKMWISQDTKPHDVTEIHVRNILKPINENFARSIDTVSNHCVPCNERVLTNFNHHALNDTHIKIIKDTHSPNTFCEDCNIYIDTHNFTVHVNSKKHLNVVMQQNSIHRTGDDQMYICKICNITVRNYLLKSHVISKIHIANKSNDSTEIDNKNNGSTKINNKNNEFTKSNNKNNDSTEINNINNGSPEIDNKNNGSTKINNKKVESTKIINKNNEFTKSNNKNNDSTEINNINNGSPEIDNKNNDSTKINNKNNDSTTINNKNNDSTKTNNKNNVSPAVGIQNNDSQYCDTCKVKVPIGGMKTHVDGKPHKKVVSKLCSENKNDIKPKENKVQSGGKSSSIAQNGSSVSTTTKNVSFASTNSMLCTESSLSNATNLSDDKIDAYYDLLDFTDDTRTIVRCKICLVNIVFVQRNIIEHMEGRSHVKKANSKKKIELFYRLLFYIDDEKTEVKCKICDVNIPYVERNITEHMDGSSHKAVENELLFFHLVTRESSGYNCECCEEHTTDYFEHINSKAHTFKYLEKYEIDKNDMRKYVYEDDINTCVARWHREWYRNLLKNNAISKINDTNYYCGMCQIKFGRITEIEHVLGGRHAKEVRKLLKSLV